MYDEEDMPSEDAILAEIRKVAKERFDSIGDYSINESMQRILPTSDEISESIYYAAHENLAHIGEPLIKDAIFLAALDRLSHIEDKLIKDAIKEAVKEAIKEGALNPGKSRKK